jgi:hypothetical protein
MWAMGCRVGGQAVWIVAVLVAAPACRGRAQPAVDQGESEERLNVISNPSMYLDTSGFDFDNEASDYEQLLAMTVWNKSRFAVRGLEGDVGWLDDEGRNIGSSPFALEGEVPAHGSRTFSISDGSMTSGTLRGGALKVAITFRRVKLDE